MVKKMEKDKMISEDALTRLEKEIQTEVDDHVHSIETMVEKKKKEILQHS